MQTANRTNELHHHHPQDDDGTTDDDDDDDDAPNDTTDRKEVVANGATVTTTALQPIPIANPSTTTGDDDTAARHDQPNNTGNDDNNEESSFWDVPGKDSAVPSPPTRRKTAPGGKEQPFASTDHVRLPRGQYDDSWSLSNKKLIVKHQEDEEEEPSLSLHDSYPSQQDNSTVSSTPSTSSSSSSLPQCVEHVHPERFTNDRQQPVVTLPPPPPHGSSNHHNHNNQRAVVRSMWNRHATLWRHRNARTAEEGIRRETTTTRQLSDLLARATSRHDSYPTNSSSHSSRRHTNTNNVVASRTLTGLINALANEVEGLRVQVRARADTPFWDKQVDDIIIHFARLGFTPLRMGGRFDPKKSPTNTKHQTSRKAVMDRHSSTSMPAASLLLTHLSNADETFDQIDVDKSGALDRDEIAHALNLVDHDKNKNDLFDDAERSETGNSTESQMIQRLATDLVKLYDFNGDGVVDRAEYQSMVEDMATLQRAQQQQQQQLTLTSSENEESWSSMLRSTFNMIKHVIGDLIGRFGGGAFVTEQQKQQDIDEDDGVKGRLTSPTSTLDVETQVPNNKENRDALPVSYDTLLDPALSSKTLGSITVSDLKLDLRRLLFGAIPLIKHITPGGPLILEPFSVTINGSFNQRDIMDSALLDAGLRQLVGRALRRRVGSLRDLLEGTVFRGRSWKLISGTGPVVQVPKLTSVEFDKEDRLIITGRARVQSQPDGPVIENAFKVRTKVGTRMGGRVIRLVEPELALVLECPKSVEDT
jgi:hypothetical protein